MFRFLTGTATLALFAGPARADHTLPSLALADAQRAIAAAVAAQPTVKENGAVIDAGGQLVAFVRQDGAISAGLYGASGKAVASARFGASGTVLEARMGAGAWTVAPTASAAPLPRPDIAWRGAGERGRGPAPHLGAGCNPDRARRHRRRRGRLRRRDQRAGWGMCPGRVQRR
jgi:hypothetical protein